MWEVHPNHTSNGGILPVIRGDFGNPRAHEIMTFYEEEKAHWEAYGRLVLALLPDDTERQAFVDWIVGGDAMRQLDYMVRPQKLVQEFKQRDC